VESDVTSGVVKTATILLARILSVTSQWYHKSQSNIFCHNGSHFIGYWQGV